jgi:hypothetical protein
VGSDRQLYAPKFTEKSREFNDFVENIASRAIVMQRKTGHPVRFEITEQPRTAIHQLIVENGLDAQDYLFSSLYSSANHLSTRQFAKLLKD